MSDEISTTVSTSLLTHFLTVGGFLLAFVAIARLLRARQQPGNTLAWLLVIILIPYLGVPLYLIFGGRKLRKLARDKIRLRPSLQSVPDYCQPEVHSPTAIAVQTNGATAPLSGNTMRLITNGEQAYADLIKCIREARYSIHITTFILGRDEVGREIISLLAQRAREGVKVRLLLDAVGCIISSFSFCDELRQAGGEVVRFMPVVPLSSRGSANLRNHRKIAVFDQHVAIIGGHNLAREYMGSTPWKKRWDDFGAVICGPAAAMLNEVFLADWTFASGQDTERLHEEIDPEAVRAEGKGELQVVASGPDVEGDPLYEGILSMIQEAEQSVWIITPYFVPDVVLLRSLLVKARAGRDVTLIVPARSNHPITDFVRRHYLRQLLRAGARVLYHTGSMMHSKAIIVDDRIGLLGSANFDMRSLFLNFEIGVMVYSQPEVNAMRIWAGSVAARCRKVDQPDLRPMRIVGPLLEDMTRLLAPLL